MQHAGSNSRAGEWTVFAVTNLGSSMAFIDETVVNVALPSAAECFACFSRAKKFTTIVIPRVANIGDQSSTQRHD